MKKKILFVVTSHDKKGNTDEPTGFYLSEVSHPWEILTRAGFEIDFVSPKGGKAPVDGFNLGDPVNKKFWNDPQYRYKIEHTLKPAAVDAGQYVAIHYAGGHGAMWDLADNEELATIARTIYEQGGVVSAVCHGPAGLVNIRLSNGQYLVSGKKINAFTNEEEKAVKLEKVVPFLLESTLIERGARFEKSGLWQEHVVTDQRVVTGQNPQSAKAVGEAVVEQITHLKMDARLTKYIVEPAEIGFRSALSNYVHQAIVREANIMAEAYYEQNDTSVLWLIERWNNPDEWLQFHKGAAAKTLNDLAKVALKIDPEVTHVKDLEPLTKTQWRKAARKDDRPLTVMLFVDAKPGTQKSFQDIYHTAMPLFRGEAGVVTHQLSQLIADDTKFVTFEKFRDEAAFQFHLKFPPIQPVIDYLQKDIKNPPFQNGLHNLIEFAPSTRE